MKPPKCRIRSSHEIRSCPIQRTASQMRAPCTQCLSFRWVEMTNSIIHLTCSRACFRISIKQGRPCERQNSSSPYLYTQLSTWKWLHRWRLTRLSSHLSFRAPSVDSLRLQTEIPNRNRPLRESAQLKTWSKEMPNRNSWAKADSYSSTSPAQSQLDQVQTLAWPLLSHNSSQVRLDPYQLTRRISRQWPQEWTCQLLIELVTSLERVHKFWATALLLTLFQMSTHRLDFWSRDWLKSTQHHPSKRTPRFHRIHPRLSP